MHHLRLALSLALLLCLSCNDNQNNNTAKSNSDSTSADSNAATVAVPDRKGFVSTINGKSTDLYVLKNSAGMTLTITNYGGRFVSLLVPDKDRQMRNVVVGFKTVQDYISSTEPYFGATIGRYGNRIARGQFTLDGKQYQLSINNGPNTLHSGKSGFQSIVWDARQLNDSTLELSYLSKDGEGGFPGNLKVKVVYGLTSDNEVTMDYEYSSDKRTVVNLTNHSFFNLNGEGSGTINDHSLMINADYFLPVDSTLIPTGERRSVAETPFDFMMPHTIGSRVEKKDQQLLYGKGYDHNFILRHRSAEPMQIAATVVGDKSGIRMEVFTIEPGLQFYSGNFMQSKNTFSNGSRDDFRTAFCLETQHFPDSPNQPSFPSTVAEPGQVYKTKSIYRFSVTSK